jgi:hypothetical protein
VPETNSGAISCAVQEPTKGTESSGSRVEITRASLLQVGEYPHQNGFCMKKSATTTDLVAFNCVWSSALSKLRNESVLPDAACTVREML